MGIMKTLNKSMQRQQELANEIYAVKKKIRKIQDNYILLGNTFLNLTNDIKPVNGCYNVGISNKITGEKGETQGDITDNSWENFFSWLLDNMEEMNIGEIQDLTIDYIEYVGKENVA